MPRNDYVVWEDISRPDFPLPSRGRGPPQAHPMISFQPTNYQKSFLLTGGMYLMKKLFKNIANTAKTAAINCQTSIAAFHRRAVCGNAGEGYIDTAVKVLIAVVLGALVLAGLYAVLNDTVMPTVTQRI